MKNLILKMTILCIIITVFQLLLFVIIYRVRPPFPELDELDRLLLNRTDVVYFGDSTISASSEEDNDRRSIAAMLQEKIGNKLSVGKVDHGAYELNIFLEYYRYILSQPHQPKFVIIPINIRSFSPAWSLRPGYQFEWEKNILQKGRFTYYMFYRPFSAFIKNNGRITQDIFMSAPVMNGKEQMGVVKDFETIDYSEKNWSVARTRTLYDYMLLLDRSHPKLNSLLLLTGLKAPKTTIIFYITPVNYQKGEKYYPDIFTQRLMENVTQVKEILMGKNIMFIDFSMKLPKNFFTGKESLFVDEHMVDEGRKLLAAELAKIIIKQQ